METAYFFELPLRVVVTILECCVTFSGVKLSIRSFVLFSLLKQSVPSLYSCSVFVEQLFCIDCSEAEKLLCVVTVVHVKHFKHAPVISMVRT